MATETEQLVVQLEARIRDFEKNMAKASGTASREFGAIERRGRESALKMQSSFGNMSNSIKKSFSGLAKGFVVGGVAGLVSEQSLRALQDVVKSVADIADEAKRVGLPVEDFQSLTFAARQSGVEADKLGDLLQKFNVEIGEASTKGNDLSKILAANGVSLTDSNGKLRTQQELFYEVVRLVSNAKNQQEAATIAIAAFGRGASDALPFLQQGVEAIKNGEQAARVSGAVIDEALVARAADFDDRWTAAMDSFAAKGKSAVLTIMADLQDMITMADDFVDRLGVKKPMFEALGNTLRANPMTAASMLAYDRYFGDGYSPLSDGKADPKGDREPVAGPATILPKKLTGDSNEPDTPKPPRVSPIAPRRRSQAIERLDLQREATNRLIGTQQLENAALVVQARAMTMTTFAAAKYRKENELLNEAKASGIPVTTQLEASMSQLATEYAKGQAAIENVRQAQERASQSAEEYKQAQERVAQSNEQFEGAFAGAAKGFLEDLIQSKDATEALQSALMNLASQLLSLSIDGMFSGLFKGANGSVGGKGLDATDMFAFLGLKNGGAVSGPGTSRSDSIPAMLSNGEYVINADATAKNRFLLDAINNGKIPRFADGGPVGTPAVAQVLGGSAAPITLNTSVNVNASGGGSDKDNAALAKQVAKEVEGSIRGLVFKELMVQKRAGNALHGMR